MSKRYFPFERGPAAAAIIVLATAGLTGPAFAQTTAQSVFGGGGGGFLGGGGGGSTSGGQQPTDPGVRGGTPGAGGALTGLSQNELNFFTAATDVFNEVETVPTGLGPAFNLDSCGGCHLFPAAGGTSPPSNNPQITVATKAGAKNTIPSFITTNGPIREARFVRNPDGSPDGGVHDLFTITGRSDAGACALQQPNFAAAVSAHNVIFRIPTPVFGTGLVEAVPDASLQASLSANAQQKSALGISGTFNRSGNDGTITRFGWKAQNKSLVIFAGEAYNVEMGVTNDAFPNERDTNPSCNLNPTPESTSNFTDTSNGKSPVSGFSQDIVNFAAFMRFLAPPTPATPSASTASTASTPTATATASVLTVAAGSTTTPAPSTTSSTTIAQGQQVFTNIGCAACHIVTQTTGLTVLGQAANNGVGPGSLSNQKFQPFSDFALHNMGTGLADGVSQGNANGNQFRSAPLWGVGQRAFFLHDGRTSDLTVAIQQHSSSGSEANTVIQNYNMLPVTSKQALINYLRSL
jgi:CxxC motif-containing protein (DUF1111 family)